MQTNKIPSDWLVRDPRALQTAQVAKNTRHVDLHTLADLLKICKGLTEAMDLFPAFAAQKKISDINGKLVSIVEEGVEGY